MELQHINVSLLLDGPLAIDAERFIDLFHRWIRNEAFDELLIDVADYRHIARGASVALIGFEADYVMEDKSARSEDDRWSLRYNRKAPLPGNNEDRMRQALRSAATCGRMLEAEFGQEDSFRFNRKQLELVINDRALAENTPETHAACTPELQKMLAHLFGHDQFRLEPPQDPRSLYGVTIHCDQPFDLETLG